MGKKISIIGWSLVTIKHYWCMYVEISIDSYICTISKILISDVANFAISAGDILPIQYIGHL